MLNYIYEIFKETIFNLLFVLIVSTPLIWIATDFSFSKILDHFWTYKIPVILLSLLSASLMKLRVEKIWVFKKYAIADGLMVGAGTLLLVLALLKNN